jgi:RNA polymerase subunit RPABC4/transcription elongation factor Spt4
VGLVAVVVLSALALFAVPASSPLGSAAPSRDASHAVASHAAASQRATSDVVRAVAGTHSDLVVPSGQTFTIAPTSPTTIPMPYYQGGNITVEAGGTLIVQDVNLTFVQFIGSNGTLPQRFFHVYTFSNYGTVEISNSWVTTDTEVLNAYLKLNLVNYGTMSLQNTSFAFPGWIQDNGTSASLTLNDSRIEANPAVPYMLAPLEYIGDNSYAASIYVSDGAHLYLFRSLVNNTYKDNTLLFGTPGPAPLSATDLALANLSSYTAALYTPGDAANLSLDWLYYPSGLGGGFGVDGGTLLINYNNYGLTTANYTVDLTVDGITFPVGALSMKAGTNATAPLTLPGALITLINRIGMLTFLEQACGDGGSCATTVTFAHTSGGWNVTINSAVVELYAASQYNMYSNHGTIVAVDSALDLSWNPPPYASYSKSPPYPWSSNLFYLNNGTTAYLANVTTLSPILGTFTQSAFVPDASSVANFYRWAQLNVFNYTLTDGKLEPEHVSGATVTPFYAFSDNQISNTTANTLNNIAGLDMPSLTGYLNFVDHEHGASRYGVSNGTGQAFVLLAASQIDGAPTLPDGWFLGDYNVGLVVPYVANTTWATISVVPYPEGVALATTGYGSTDLRSVEVPLPPPSVKLSNLAIVGVAPGGQLNLANSYSTSGLCVINGPGYATVTISATPVGSAVGGSSTVTLVEDTTVANGTFLIAWNSISGVLSSGTTYQITASATYKTASDLNVGVGSPDTYSVPSSPSAVGFLFQKFLGLPLWIWIAIAAAVVVAIVAALLVTRRQAAGKLVECGECGELIPEDATVCPKCGAQFESELVRCSRCSSTIPANSQFCPECGAQLLGKPGEGASDPERQAYADFTEKYRAEAKRELGENYTESAFWDWWKRQPTYVPFSQWKVQQTKGAPRAGMSAPPAGSETVPPGAPPKAEAASGTAPLVGEAPAPGATPAPPAPGAPMPPPPAAAAGSGLKPCPNCGKEIPPEYLVCPFCGAVTQ